jgi:hypothetical protein
MAEFVRIAGRLRDNGRETSRARTESGHRHDRGASFGPGLRLPLAAAIEDPGGSLLDECQCPVRRVEWAEQAAVLGTHELAWLRGGGAEMMVSKDWCA